MVANAEIYPKIIRLAANCGKASDFQRVLQELTDYAEAYACIIWEIFKAGTDERKFFKLTDYLPAVKDPKTQPSWHFLPKVCVTGAAIREDTPMLVDDIPKAMSDGRVPRGELLLSRGISMFCCLPITFGKNREAAVNFYWRGRPSTPPDLNGLHAVAKTLPDLNRGVLNQMGFQLLQAIENDLNGKGEVLQSALSRVADQFNAYEAAIYLEDQYPGVYQRKAGICNMDYPPRKEYRKGDDGLTIWAIENAREVRFVHLDHFEDERQSRKYDNMKWASREDLLRNAKRIYGEPLPPVGFLCVPIVDRQHVVGAIRCCMTTSAPHLFDESHIAILKLVADQIGHWWGNTRLLATEQADTKRFTSLLKGIGQMDDTAVKILRDPRAPYMPILWERALALVEAISPWPDALSIRTVDDSSRELQFAATRGAAWKADGERRYRARIERRYPLSEDFAGSRAVKTCKPVIESEAGQEGHLRSELFPAATKLIHAPIVFGNRAIGVLDVRGFGNQAIPANLGLMCELIARQLGLYYNMHEQFQIQRKQEQEIQRQYQVQNQVYEDFLHQLRNPLVKATILAEHAAKSGSRLAVDPKQLEAFVRQALQFSESMNHYTALARDEPLTTDIDTLSCYDLLVKLNQLADDENLIVPSERGLVFRVDEPTFEPLRDKYFDAAVNLLDHCLFNLLDNAAKYSHSNTEITIRGRFYDNIRTMAISVINKGHRIESPDRARLVRRGERGERAKKSTAGGRGIGLWIVDRFMAAMKGELRVIPTDGSGRNEFQLIFKYRLGR